MYLPTHSIVKSIIFINKKYIQNSFTALIFITNKISLNARLTALKYIMQLINTMNLYIQLCSACANFIYLK